MLDMAVINGEAVTPGGRRAPRRRGRQRPDRLAGAARLIAGGSETIDAAGLTGAPRRDRLPFSLPCPQLPEREDFASGTRAAAAGGVTTLLEMPIAIPPTTDGAALADRRAHAERDAYIDVGFYASSATLDPAQDRLRRCGRRHRPEGIPAGGAARTGGVSSTASASTATTISCARLTLVAETGLPAVFHAEDYPTYSLLEQRLRHAGRKDPAGSCRVAPRLRRGAGDHQPAPPRRCRRGTSPHSARLFGVRGDVIRDGKRRGVRRDRRNVSRNTLPSPRTAGRTWPYAKCNPPLKSKKDVPGLWEGVRDGTIDTVATDHSPFTPADKEPGWDDIWQATPGFPGVDILTPFMIGAALEGKIPLERAIALITANPADIFGLAPRKGRLLPGADADLTLYDPSGSSVVDTATWQTRASVCGRVWQGYPLDWSGRDHGRARHDRLRSWRNCRFARVRAVRAASCREDFTRIRRRCADRVDAYKCVDCGPEDHNVHG